MRPSTLTTTLLLGAAATTTSALPQAQSIPPSSQQPATPQARPQSTPPALPQPGNQDAKARAEAALKTLQTWYNPDSGIWDTCGWWNGANCMTALTNLALLSPDSTYVQDTARSVFNTTFRVGPAGANPRPGANAAGTSASATVLSATPSATPGFANPTGSLGDGSVASGAGSTGYYKTLGQKWVDGSYDDDEWWALAWIAAYDLTGHREYLDVAIGVFELLASTEQTNCGGGIWSDPNKNYINAVTNELFISIAAHLANRAPNGQKYLQIAQKQWDWFSQKDGMINENGTINDGLSNCKNNGQPEWSYNQGVILGALVELHRASPKPTFLSLKPSTSNTHNTTYLESASNIAHAAIDLLADGSGVVRESCDPDSCDANSTQFKGIFIRNLAALHGVAPDQAFAEVIKASAQSIWTADQKEDGKFGEDWTGASDKVDASTHSCAFDALVADILV